MHMKLWGRVFPLTFETRARTTKSCWCKAQSDEQTLKADTMDSPTTLSGGHPQAGPGPDTHLRAIDQQLRPLLPQGALVPVLKRGLGGGPAALLVAVPEGGQADALLQVGHPVHGQVDDPGQGAWKRQREALRGSAPGDKVGTQSTGPAPWGPRAEAVP